jgi:hypothetical protein
MPHTLRGRRRHGLYSGLGAGEVEGWLDVSHLQRTVVTADDVGASQGRAPPTRLGFLDEGLRSAPRARGQKGHEKDCPYNATCRCFRPATY